MRAGTYFLITVFLAALLQGCGRKAPLSLPASKPQAPKTQASGTQTPDLHKSGAPSTLQDKKP